MLFCGTILGFISLTNSGKEWTNRYSGVIKIFANLNEKGAPWGALIILLLFLSFQHEDGSSDRPILKPVDTESLDVKYFLNIAAPKNKFIDQRAD